MTSREAYIALNMVDGVGPIRVRALRDRFGEAQAILAASKTELMQVEGVGEEVAVRIRLKAHYKCGQFGLFLRHIAVQVVGSAYGQACP